jgi:diketogulonate reductase-like aldo/keto reductase
MKHVTLKGGETVPALGLGTWRMGEKRSEKAREVELLRAGLDMGFTLIDTAEMYGEGGAEEVTGEAVKGRRDRVFIVSKVYPHNASREGAVAACERSLKRLGTDRIDLYLLHWPGSHPVADTVAAFEQLKGQGKIRHWGVSNFDTAGMKEVTGVPGGGTCAANQVLYHLGSRGIEWELLPAMQKAKIAVMAYSPLGQGPLLSKPALLDLARSLGVSAATLALALMLRHPGVIAIPKTSRKERLKDFLAAADLELDTATVAALDKAFPPPKRAAPLAMN